MKVYPAYEDGQSPPAPQPFLLEGVRPASVGMRQRSTTALSLPHLMRFRGTPPGSVMPQVDAAQGEEQLALLL